jgi:hypothetical protein
MTYTFFTINSESDEEEYSSFVELEDFEEDEVPEGFEGLQKGSSLEGGPSEEAELPRPWDPAESFFAYL